MNGIRTTLEALRTCLATHLVTMARPVCHLPIIWGAAPLPAQRCDCECDHDGQGEGWLRVVSFTALPGAGRGHYSGCPGAGWEAVIEAGLWRCALTLDEAGNPPPDTDYDAHTRLMLADARALTAAWECCTWFTDKGVDRVLNTVVPSGPSGGCVGVIATGRVRLGGCGCT